MRFADFALHHVKGLFVTLAVLVLLGIASISSLPMSIFPKVAFARIVIVAENGEMAPTQVQQNITRPLEQAVSIVPDVTLVQGNSAQGTAQISVNFEPRSDINVDLQRVNAAISQIRSALPPDTNVDAQIVNPNIFPILGYTLSIPGKTLTEVRNTAEFTIKPALTGIRGLAQVRTVGGRQREYWVSVDPTAISTRHMPVNKIADAIASNNKIVSVGHYNAFEQRSIVLVSGNLRTPDDIANVVVDTQNGVPIRVGDVADVHDALEPLTTQVVASGENAVLMNFYAQPGANFVQLYRDVDTALQKEAKALGPGVEIQPYWNQATLVNDAVRNLRDAIAIGAALAVLVMWFFLGSIRSTLVAAAVIPLTICIAFFFMRLTGQGLNLMTLGGLAIGVGLIIVDAIFVVENIWRHLKTGEERIASVRKAMEEIAAPMIGSTITTVVVFAPMALLSGVTGAFFTALSITLAITLGLSLFFALYITPLLSVKFLDARQPPNTKPDMGTRVMDGLLRAYEPALLWMLRNRRVAYAVTAGVVFLTLLMVRGIPSDFMPKMDEGAFEFNFKMPPGTSLAETNRALKQVETIVRTDPQVVGDAGVTGLDPSGSLPAAQNVGGIRATLYERDKRKESIDQVADRIRDEVHAKIPILQFSISQILSDLLNDLSNAPATIEIKIFGNDQVQLIDLAQAVDQRIQSVHGVVDDFNGIVYNDPNTIVEPLPAVASRAGFTTDSFAQALAVGLNGNVVSSVPLFPVQIPIRVRYNTPWDQRLSDVQNMPIVAPNGSTYSLSALASTIPTGLTTELNEENLQQVVRVTANTSGRDLGSTITEIKARLADLKIPPGYRIVYGGRFALQQQSFKEFGLAIGVAVLLVFMTMIFEFRNYRVPLVIICSVPLSLFGVVIALRLTGIPLNVSSFMGLILLVGGVVKNGILLFDEVDRIRKDGKSIEETMLEAGRTRMRPILMTTLTSLLGVVPLALGFGAGSEMQKPLAVATIGGLVFSTFFTLLLMPVFYASFTRIADGKLAEQAA